MNQNVYIRCEHKWPALILKVCSCVFPVGRESLWTTAPRQTSQSGNTTAASRRPAVGRRRMALCTIYCWTENKYQLQHISAELSCQRLSEGAVYICWRNFILKDSFGLVSNLDHCVEICNKHRNQKHCLFLCSTGWFIQQDVHFATLFWRGPKLIHFRCQKSWIHKQKSKKSADFLKKIFFAHWVCSWMPLRQARDGWREKGRNKKKMKFKVKV